MKQKKENRVALLLHWAGGQKIWLFLAILLSMCSGLCIIVPYIGIYRLMDATFNNACTKELVVQTVAMIAAAVTLRFALFGCSGVAAHKGAYGALFKVRCMVAEHMARAPLGALNERRTGDIKTVLNEDIEKLELFLAHNLPDLVCYLVGPVVIFIYLMTVNIPLALISLVPLILAVVVMGMICKHLMQFFHVCGDVSLFLWKLNGEYTAICHFAYTPPKFLQVCRVNLFKSQNHHFMNAYCWTSHTHYFISVFGCRIGHQQIHLFF